MHECKKRKIKLKSHLGLGLLGMYNGTFLFENYFHDGVHLLTTHLFDRPIYKNKTNHKLVTLVFGTLYVV